MIAASAYAFYAGTFRWVPAVLCLLVALLAQVASNMANDYFDYVKGSDKAGRVGLLIGAWGLTGSRRKASTILMPSRTEARRK